MRLFALPFIVMFVLVGCDKKAETTEEKASSEEEAKPSKKKAAEGDEKKAAEGDEKKAAEGDEKKADKPAVKAGGTYVGTDDAGNKKVVAGATSVTNGPGGPTVKAGDVKMENGKLKVPGLPPIQQ